MCKNIPSIPQENQEWKIIIIERNWTRIGLFVAAKRTASAW